MKALHRDPEWRFQSADEFGEAIDLASGRNGVAKTRDVAQVVRTLDAEKLQEERQRVRDAIEMLGRAEFAESTIPMPREGVPATGTTMRDRTTTGSHIHGSVSGVLDDGTPVVVRPAGDSNALKWFVTALAVLVFLYAGFLVWELLFTPSARRAPEPSRAVEVAAPAPVAPVKPRAVERLEVAPVPTRETERTDVVPERKSSPEPSRPSRRRARAKSRANVTRVGESKKAENNQAKSPTPAPASKADPVDIDVRNPYRN
jgi:hypothetical protein